MKMKKLLALALAGTLTFSLVGCGGNANNGATEPTATEDDTEAAVEGDEEAGKETGDESGADTGELSYANIVVGESYQDVTATLKVLSNRTDLADTKLKEYSERFNELYPNITVEYETVTDYAEDALLRLSAGNWGDIMLIPAVEKSQLSSAFISFGDLETVSELANFVTDWSYEGQVYGIPCTGTARGIVYNKAVFEKAGITELPTTPEEFIAALQSIKDNTDAIPLYTNYAAGWTMGAWDDYISGAATGDAEYKNNKLLHTSNPFAKQDNGSGPYSVYKVLYDAVAGGLTEDDYSTTDWEGSKGMLNRGEIGCMVLGSWAYPQMQEAGDHPDDIGYMPFPVEVDGKQYAAAGGDYNYAINANSSEDNQKAAMLYVKWMTEQSGFAYSEGGIPIDVNGEYPDLYSAFDGVTLVSDAPAAVGEEDILSELNAESELNIGNGGDSKIQAIIEHAANGTKTFDEIMDEWNAAWSAAQESVGVSVE